MTIGQTGNLWPVPKKHTKRNLPKGLREDLAYNLRAAMDSTDDLKTSKALGLRTQLGRRTIDRYLSKESPAGVDELQVLGEALDIPPWMLLRKRPMVVHEIHKPQEPLLPRRPGQSRQDREQKDHRKIRR